MMSRSSHSFDILVGDRILSVTISFENMVYEDALTILSYASPYPVTLHLASGNKSADELQMPTTPKGTAVKQNKVFHPVYRSQSLGGNIIKPKRQQKLLPPRPGTSLDQLVLGKSAIHRWSCNTYLLLMSFLSVNARFNRSSMFLRRQLLQTERDLRLGLDSLFGDFYSRSWYLKSSIKYDNVSIKIQFHYYKLMNYLGRKLNCLCKSLSTKTIWKFVWSN